MARGAPVQAEHQRESDRQERAGEKPVAASGAAGDDFYCGRRDGEATAGEEEHAEVRKMLRGLSETLGGRVGLAWACWVVMLRDGSVHPSSRSPEERSESVTLHFAILWTILHTNTTSMEVAKCRLQ